MVNDPDVKKVSRLLRSISQPARLRILTAIGQGEACVCHLEVMLGYRQAYISQHLMGLRKAGILTSRRDGRFIFYRLKDLSLLDLIAHAQAIAGVPQDAALGAFTQRVLPGCCCPDCVGEGAGDCGPLSPLAPASADHLA